MVTERRRERPRWHSRILLFAPYLVVVLVSFVGFRRLENERHDDCISQRDGRTVLRSVVVEATTPGGAASVDLSRIPGFSDLDAATQTYLRNLSAALSSTPTADQPTLRDRLLLLAPDISCP